MSEEALHSERQSDSRQPGDHGADDFQIGPYPSYKMGPMEILLVFLLFLLWFYALRRIYKVWTNILNFSDISSDSFGQRHGKAKIWVRKFWDQIEICSQLLCLDAFYQD